MLSDTAPAHKPRSFRTGTGIFLFVLIPFLSVSGQGDPSTVYRDSRIDRVQVFRGRAMITRTVPVNLRAGNNEIRIEGLPDNLLDRSVTGSLPDNFPGRLGSISVKRRALEEETRKEVAEIESRLEVLKDRDRVLADQLKTLDSQENFLEAIQKTSADRNGEAIRTGSLSFESLEKSFSFSRQKLDGIFEQRRKIELQRRDLGKKIEEMEFELSRLAGDRYYQNYENRSRTFRSKGGAPEVQSYLESTALFQENRRFQEDFPGKLRFEKELQLTVNSVRSGKADFTFSYLMEGASWNMSYDLSADPRGKNPATLTVYGEIRQNTGENWENVDLLLSTGNPVQGLRDIHPVPWIIDVRTYQEQNQLYRNKKAMPRQDEYSTGAMVPVQEEAEAPPPPSEVVESGPYMQFKFPSRTTIASSRETRKKTLLQKDLSTDEKDFRYEVYTETGSPAVLKLRLKNDLSHMLLPGNARLFLGNQYTGQTSLPGIPAGGERDIVMGSEERLMASKTLVTRYRDSKGVFGDKIRMKYSYLLELESYMPRPTVLFVYDRIPVSRHEDVQVEILYDGDRPPLEEDSDFAGDSRYEQGIRRYRVSLNPGEKKKIRYEIAVTYPSDLTLTGLP